MDRRKELLIRVYIVTALFSVIALVLIIKAFWINVVEGEELRKKSRELLFAVQPIKAERGKILADDGSPLATSQPIFELRMDLKAAGLKEELFNLKLDSLSHCLSNFLYADRSKAEVRQWLKKARKNGDRYLLIAKNLNYEQMIMVRNFPLFNQGPNKGGLIVISETRREKPYKMFASRTIGLDRQNADPIGLEQSFDAYLSGEEGHRVVRKVGGNHYIPVDGLEEILPKKGCDVITTINPGIQEVAELALEDAIVKHQAENGCAIVMEVATGAIKAIANLGWDANGELIENYNYAVGKSTEPGSTFKLASLIALLEEGTVDTGSLVNLNGGSWNFYNELMRDSKMHGVGMADLAYSFVQSSNVGISKLVDAQFGKNPERFISYLKKMGLDLKTGIEIEGEPAPFIKSPSTDKKLWYGTSLPWMSVGYELQLTPLQMLSFYNAIGNKGKMVKPRLVEKVVNGSKTLKECGVQILRDTMVSPHTMDKVFALMREVVSNGTAKNIQSDAYEILGKTGTAVSNYYHRDASKKNYQASFAGFFPGDHPVYSCIVVIYNPQQMGYYGAEVAGPVFRKIADRCMRGEFSKVAAINLTPKSVLAQAALPCGNKGFARDFKVLFGYLGLPFEAGSPSSWIQTYAGEDGIMSSDWSFDSHMMPDLRGLGLRDAIYLMDAYGARLIPVGSGKIISQSVAPGSWIEKPVVVIKLN